MYISYVWLESWHTYQPRWSPLVTMTAARWTMPCSLWLPPFNLSSTKRRRSLVTETGTVKCGGWIFIPGNKGHIDCWGCLRCDFMNHIRYSIKPMGNGWKWWWFPGHPDGRHQDKSQLKQEWKEHHFALHVYRKFFGCMTCYWRWIDLDIDALLGGDLCFF